MARLTFCLITMGRQQFIDPLLRSFEGILKNTGFDVLIILNGVSTEIAQFYISWGAEYPDQVKVIINNENNASLSAFLPIITKVKTEWICFPSDDDVLDPVFFSNWIDFAHKHKEYGVISTALNLTDSDGQTLGIQRLPAYSINLNFIENAAKSFSECPFLWPGLIIRVNEIPSSAPSTRYVSDWWLGLHLIMGTRIKVISESFTNYRVHDMQESHVSSLSRKNFEALVHLGNFITSERFTNWITQLELPEVIQFLECLIKYPPLYADPKFSSELVSIITNHIKLIRTETEIRKVAVFVNALAHDALMHQSQLMYVDDIAISKYGEVMGFNFNLVFDTLCCPKIKAIQTRFSQNFSHFPTQIVGCAHSKKNRDYLILDCLSNVNESQIVDSISKMATEKFKSLDLFDTSVSPFEYSLIKVFRRFKYVFPSGLNRIFFTVFRK